MVPNGSAYANYPSYANNGAKTPPGGSPESAKYALGMVPADTFPAEWANWLFHGATAGITRLNADVGSIKKEINSLLAAYNITPDASVFNQLYQAIEKRLSSLYPVGTVYQNADSNKNPGDSDMLGFGTWEPITDKFLAARGSTNIGASGGQWTVTLTANNIPRHRHVVDAHAHNMEHTHATVPHKHTRGSFEITGSVSFADVATVETGVVSAVSGAFIKSSRPSSGQFMQSVGSGFAQSANYIDFAASRNWTGESSTEAPDTYGASKSYTGDASPGTDYQYAEHPAAISITPTYVGVYTWKRTV